MNGLLPGRGRRRAKRQGFSLIEVTMALMIISVGVVALLGLFPVGLRESSLATADTAEAIFATRVLNSIQANALAIDKWDDWIKNDSFTRTIKIDGQDLRADGATHTINDYNNVSKNVIRYRLQIGAVGGYEERLRYAAIRVANDKYSKIDDNTVYYTEFRYNPK